MGDAQPALKNWKGKAYAAIAKYYEVEAEREAFEAKLEAAKQEAIRAGVEFRYGNPDVRGIDAVACACGAVVPLDYSERLGSRVFTCDACTEKTRAAVEQDEAEEALPPPSLRAVQS